jgi:hypothetical protein
MPKALFGPLLTVVLITTGCGGVTSTGTVPAPSSSAAATSSADKAAPAREPVLGAPFERSEGFGTARPRMFSLGSATSELTGVHWDSWGAATATGTATATYVAAGQANAEGSSEPARVVASDLGTCQGQPAYQKVSWYFPQHGETLEKHEGGGGIGGFNACTGDTE